MIQNYLKIAFRNLVRHKGYALINIIGLAVGITSCLLLFLVVNYELGYDKEQPNYDKIYHVVTQDKYAEGMTYNSGIPVPALEAMRLKMPDAVFAGINAAQESQVTVGGTSNDAYTDKKFLEETGIFFCEPQFFELFKYNWLNGDANILKQPNTVALTKKMAEKYFGKWQDAPGKFIKLDNAITLRVSGIIDDIKQNTDFPLGVVVSFETLKNNGERYNYIANNWGGTSSNFQVFTMLQNKQQAAEAEKMLLSLSKEKYTSSVTGTSKKSHFIVPLSNLHFDNRFESFGTHITSKATLWTLTLIGLFIIVMACINFINLATALAVGRSKEVGIRKVLGSNRKQLFGQVMGETGIVVGIAGIVALALAFFSLPFIKHIASIEEQLQLFSLQNVLFVICLVAGVTLLAGLYPSIVLSGFKPVAALRNKFSSAKVGGISLRRGLVVMQFVISQVLIIGTIVAISQMNFIKNADLGFDKEAVLLLSGNSDSSVTMKQPAFKQSLLQTPGIQSVSFNTDAPSSENSWTTNFAFDHREDEKYQLSLKFADEDYFKTFGIQLAAGNFYSKSDTAKEIVINETLVKKLGLKNTQDAVGKDIRTGRGPWKQIVGVVKDFKTTSFKEAIPPLLIAQERKYYSLTAVKIRSNNPAKSQADIQATWNKFFPEHAYSSAFLDENISKFYEQENQLSLLYKIFAGLALFISSVGLYGLVSFMAVQKVKEVGIRKTLGASVSNIVYLFSKEFTWLIGIAFLIAAPLAWFMMKQWLQDFVFRIDIGAGVFVLAILISIIIAWITVGYKAVKAAVANPVKSLRSE